MHDSDWFAGECPCNDYPCKRAVAAQKHIEACERFRIALLRVYYRHHGDWPQGLFIDEIIEVFRSHEDRSSIEEKA